MSTDRDVEKTYPIHEFVAKLRRLADCLENGSGLKSRSRASASMCQCVRSTTSSTNAKTARTRLSSKSSGKSSKPLAVQRSTPTQ